MKYTKKEKMRKPSWEKTLEVEGAYVQTLVTCMYNHFRDTGTTNDYQNGTENRNDANLLEEDTLTELAGKAFKKAYEAWDGVRKFRPLYRVTYLNLVKNAAKRERLRTYRFPKILNITNELGESPLNNVADMRTYLQPEECTDFTDFVETLPDHCKILVNAILNPEILGVESLTTMRDVADSLSKYARSLGWNKHYYARTFTEIKKKLKERANGTNTLRKLYPKESIFQV